jgi:hypothetical protein
VLAAGLVLHGGLELEILKLFYLCVLRLGLKLGLLPQAAGLLLVVRKVGKLLLEGVLLLLKALSLSHQVVDLATRIFHTLARILAASLDLRLHAVAQGSRASCLAVLGPHCLDVLLQQQDDPVFIN